MEAVSKSKYAQLSREEETRLVFLAKAGDPDAAASLLAHFEPLLESAVVRFGPTHEDSRDELRGAARVGFATALDGFVRNRGYRFATLLRVHVRRQIVDTIRRANRDRHRQTGEPRHENVDEQVRLHLYELADPDGEEARDRVSGALERVSDWHRRLLVFRFVDRADLQTMLASLKDSGEFTGNMARLRRELAAAQAALRAEFLRE